MNIPFAPEISREAAKSRREIHNLCAFAPLREAPPAFREAAFTLIELLVVIAIIAVLSSLVFGVAKNAQKSADRVDGISNMRQLGLAIQNFAADHDGSLPGPMWQGVPPWYQSGDQLTLGCQLWSYLEAAEPKSWSQEMKVLTPKAYLRACPKKDAMAFILNTGVTINGQNLKPWGYQSEGTSPVKIAFLASSGLSKTWAIQDVDKTSPFVTPATGWYSPLPAKPLYAPYRLKLFFDWHVALDSI